MDKRPPVKEPKHYGVKLPLSAWKNRSRIHIDPTTILYKTVYSPLTAGVKVVLQAILSYTDSGTNLISIGGDTLEAIAEQTRFTKEGVRNAVAILKKANLIESTGLRGEYIVNPMFAIRGDYLEAWGSYQKIEGQRRQSNEKAMIPTHTLE